MLTIIGTGLLGSNFTKALLAKGEKVNVWNRTAEKAKVLEADGAKVFEDVADAVKGSDRVHVILSDDDSVDEVLEHARPGLAPGTFILDHTTTTKKGAIKRTQQWAKDGFTYVHAPVFMGPANALDSSGFMLISGDQEIVEKVTPWLTPMTGKLINLGERTGDAAGIKLLGNLFYITMVGGFSDMLALSKSLDISTGQISNLFQSWNPGNVVPARFAKIAGGNFDDPSWELQMARKDARLMMEEAQNGNEELSFIPVVAREMDKWLEKGAAHKDWTIIASETL